jgi:Flp pilus assembly protein TadG
MPRRHARERRLRRGGVATVELALLLPFLCFLFVVSVDFARVFYFAITVQNCARNGAYYASNYPNTSYIYNDIYGYTSISDAVTRDAGNLSATPTYSVAYSSSPSGPFNLTTEPSTTAYLQVTVSWTFQTITHYPGVPQTVNLSRSSIMQVAPAMPQFN